MYLNRVMAINLKGTFLGMKSVLPHMVEQGSGSIVNAASVGGVVGAPGLCAYSASKHAIIGLTRTAAAEVAQHGVRVNAICPSAIQTRMIDSLASMYSPDDPDKVRDQFVARNPTRALRAAGRSGTGRPIFSIGCGEFRQWRGL